MPRPPVEVADIIRAAGESFFGDSRKWLTWLHLKVLNAILRCRTAALGGHVDACSKCGHEAVSYNSCRNRHCPKCQANARDRWIEERGKDLLPTRYALAASGPVKESTIRKLPPPVDRNAGDAATLEQVLGFYHETLKQSPEALAYLEKRGLAHPEIVDPA